MEFMHTHAALQGLICAHIDAHQTEGMDWPNDAQFCLVLRFKAWPCDFGPRNVEFFATKEQYEERLSKLREWARFEDNYVEYRAYEWDWGPQYMASGMFGGF